MRNKFFVIIFIFTGSVFAQINSTYSYFGVGIPEYSNSIRRMGMGDFGVSVADEDYLSSLNPASYSKLLFTRVEFSQIFGAVSLKNSVYSNYYSGAYFNGFTFAFPVSYEKGISIAGGLSDYSRMKYESREYISTNPLDLNKIEATYKGEGGLSKLFLASTFRFPFNVTLGASLDYYIGKFSFESGTNFVSTEYQGSTFTSNEDYKGLGTTIGLISGDFSSYFNAPKTISDLRLGFSFSTASKLTGEFSNIMASKSLIDTIFNIATSLELPDKYIVGLSAIIFENYLLTVDYLYQPWEKFRLDGKPSSNLQNSTKFNLGIEYKPKLLQGSSTNPTIWRAGFGFEQTPFYANGYSIKQLTVSSGLSFPISRQNTIDIGLQYIRRGTIESGLVKEDMIKLGVGFSLGELWFTRSER